MFSRRQPTSEPRPTSRILVAATGFVLGSLFGSRLPLPGSIAQAALNVLGCWALLIMLGVAWNQGRQGASALGHMTALAARTLALPVALAALLVAVVRALLG